MNKLLFLLIIVSLFPVLSHAQSEKNYPYNVLSINSVESLKGRYNNYRNTIAIADSLNTVYETARFDVQLENSTSYESGSGFILNLYKKAKDFKKKAPGIDEKIAIAQKRCDEEAVEAKETQYARIIQKAEEYYDQGNLDKAIELYKRAVSLKPSDKKAAERLEELRQSKEK